jgi:DNA-binding SARP family transcriptional activator
VNSSAVERVAFGVLGPVGISVAGCPLPLGSAKTRSLLAALLLNAGRTVSPSRLTDVLWDDDPPHSAPKNLHQYVHRLRGLLAGHGLTDRLDRRPGGYLLHVSPGELDLDCFEALTALGRRARDHGDLWSAARSLAEALALWRDDPLDDVRGSRVLDVAAEALTERRLCVIEEHIAIELELGGHGPLVPELAGLVAAHPLRERLREYHMIALYASGRRADALAAYQDCRSLLVRELGIEPGPGLREVLSSVLADDGAALAERVGVAVRAGVGTTAA